MKIAVIGPQFPDSFADNIVDSLRSMGHEAVAIGPVYPLSNTKLGANAVDLARRFTPLEIGLQKRLASRVLAVSPEVVLTVEGSLLPATVAKLRSDGARVALWFPDHVANLGRMVMFVAGYDALFFKEPRLVERSRALLDVPIHYLPEACNERWHRPFPPDDRRMKVVVAGNLHPYRVHQLERLMKEDIPLEIYGQPLPRWLKGSPVTGAHMGRSIAREEKARVFRQAAAVLNQMHPGEIDGLNCRLFEAAGSGAAVVTEDRSELPKFFTPGNEVTTYGGFGELVEKLHRLLEKPDEGRRLGDAASRRAHGDHTYEHRLGRLLALAGKS